MKEAEEVWQRFVQRPGATVEGVVGIASEHAIGGLLRVIETYRPRRILELGAGIGTLTYTLLSKVVELGLHEAEGYVFYTVENEPFCKEQLANNMAEHPALYQRVDSTEELPESQVYDLIVVDGGGDLPNDMGVMSFADCLSRGGIIFVEGGRAYQRGLIEQWYGHRPHVAASIRAPRARIVARDETISAKNKGYHLFLFEPSATDRVLLPLRAFWSRIQRRVSDRLQSQ